MIISVQNQKGGVGKTTLAIHISHALALQKKQVLLVDADPQGSARDWAAARADEPPFSVVGLDRPTIHRDLPSMAKNYDHVVIDGPPRVSDLARSAIAASDLVLIPVQPSPYDVWAAKEVIDLFQEASVFKEKLKSVFVINRKIVNTAIGRDVVEALSGYEVDVLQSQICQRVPFAESAAAGLSAKKVSFGTKPKSAAASVDEWVETRTTNSQQGQDTSQASDLPLEASEKLKRLTLDIPETLHRAIKSHAVSEGRTMVDMLRELLEETYG